MKASEERIRVAGGENQIFDGKMKWCTFLWTCCSTTLRPHLRPPRRPRPPHGGLRVDRREAPTPRDRARARRRQRNPAPRDRRTPAPRDRAAPCAPSSRRACVRRGAAACGGARARRARVRRCVDRRAGAQAAAPSHPATAPAGAGAPRAAPCAPNSRRACVRRCADRRTWRPHGRASARPWRAHALGCARLSAHAQRSLPARCRSPFPQRAGPAYRDPFPPCAWACLTHARPRPRRARAGREVRLAGDHQ